MPEVRSLLLGVLLVLLLVFAPPAAASVLVHPDLDSATERLFSSRGPEAYTTLRKVWDTWDRADPERVEQVLRLAADSAKLSPQVRAYARLLSAYARSRRGDLATARRIISELGYVDQWLAVGPFDNEGKAGFDEPFEPERDLSEPLVPGRAFTGKERPVRWRRVPAAFPYGWLDFGALMRPQGNICAYATTFVSFKGQRDRPQPVSLWVGSGGAFKLFFNGQEVLSDPAYRGHDVDRMARVVSLQPGLNNLTVKVCGTQAPPVVSVRVADRSGAFSAPVQFTADFADSAEATHNAAGTPDEVLRKSPLEGPLQTFRRLLDPPQPTSRLLEDFAEYLVLTHADDPAEHQARDMIQKAAESDPTVSRLLLAASLAEDQNGAARWLDKAESLARTPGDQAQVAVAQGNLELSKPTWPSAMPLFERALALDPDHVGAVGGLVALHSRARLNRTALAIVERALERRPRSVSLLGMQASQLRSLGRDSEAAEVESRYAALRFDDRQYLQRQVNLAVARREVSAAEHWIERLLQADSDSLWALTVASQAYRSLGKHERAAVMLERALSLAPEDVETLRTLANLEGELGHRDRQLELLERLLKIRPQDRQVREYVDFLRPSTARPDEAYAWKSQRFLKKRHAPADGQNKRTLRNLTVTTVFNNGLSSRFHQIVFQPLTDAAAAMARQYVFSYQADRQIVRLRGARVFRKDGRIDEAIEYGEGAADNPELSIYTSARNFYVQFPRLEPGDVVELRYRVDDIASRNELADYFGDIVYFEDSEPVDNAEYVLITPRDRRLNTDVQVSGVSRTVTEKGNRRITRFFAPHLDAVAPEPAMPPWGEVLGYVHVSTYKSWKALGRWYWGLVKDQFVLDEETRRLAHRLARGANTTREKVEAVYRWVVQNTRYVALEFGIYGYKPRRSVQTVARGWGDCKDKATVIVSLLGELGIESTPVILRTQMRGQFASKVASLEPFDHAIVYVPSLDLFLDGTAENAGLSELPIMDRGALGLLVNQGNSRLTRVPYPKPEENIVYRTVRGQLDKEGGARLDLDMHVKGFQAPEWRRRYGAESTREERLTEDIAAQVPGFRLAKGPLSTVSSGLDDITRPVELRVKGSVPNFGRRQDSELSIPVTTSLRLTPTYASLSRRKQDVWLLDFSSVDDTYVIDLPPGSKVTGLPPSASVTSEFGSYRLEVRRTPGRVTVRSRIAIFAPRVVPAKYSAWKAFCAEVDESLSHRLTVRP